MKWKPNSSEYLCAKKRKLALPKCIQILLLNSSFCVQALAHKTLVLLLGVDPSKQLDQPLPTAHPHVTYAYMKYMWKSARKVRKP